MYIPINLLIVLTAALIIVTVVVTSQITATWITSRKETVFNDNVELEGLLASRMDEIESFKDQIDWYSGEITKLTQEKMTAKLDALYSAEHARTFERNNRNLENKITAKERYIKELQKTNRELSLEKDALKKHIEETNNYAMLSA